MKSQTRTVAVINKAKILVIENGEKLVPIKPICEALGVDVDSQRKKINEDEILGLVAVLSTATGSDGKQYEMFCLPYKFIFGWLFTINPKNVKEEAKEGVINYKLACYEALYQNFTDQAEFLEMQQKAINEKIDMMTTAKHNFKNARTILNEAEKSLDQVRNMTFDEWKGRQTHLFEQ
jgi:hypothetical protein